MKKIDLGQTLTILANAGVIVGIVFLAFELQQANRIAIASTELSVRESYAAFNEVLLTDSDTVEVLLKVAEPEPTLDAVEQIQIRSFLRRMTNTWIAIETAYENGLVSADTYSIATSEPGQVLAGYPGAKPYMRMIVDQLGASDTSRVLEAIYQALGETEDDVD